MFIFTDFYWHHFRMHDFDNNTKLDGLEILKALTHLLPYDSVDDEDKTKIDTRGKTADEILKEKREKELSYYTGNDNMHYHRLFASSGDQYERR
jgi:hypothetical protein